MSASEAGYAYDFKEVRITALKASIVYESGNNIDAVGSERK